MRPPLWLLSVRADGGELLVRVVRAGDHPVTVRRDKDLIFELVAALAVDHMDRLDAEDHVLAQRRVLVGVDVRLLVQREAETVADERDGLEAPLGELFGKVS